VPVLRGRSGALTFAHSVSLGRWAARQLAASPPDLCYAFTQVARESFEVCARAGVPTILESPNGHLQSFRQIYLEEHQAWCGGTYRGHPTEAMVTRVGQEYDLARRIRVSSKWSSESLRAAGVPPERIVRKEQPVDLGRYQPPQAPRAHDGPLRVCFVGSLDLRKGFVYLLDAMSGLDPARFSLELVGATGDRCSRRLLEGRLSSSVSSGPGDPRNAYARAHVFALPTLEDGSPFAAAEAMASGLPIVVTSSCGAAEWVTPETGWVVPPRDAGALRRVLIEAAEKRPLLAAMGRQARLDTERRAGEHCFRALAEWVTAIAEGRSEA
jgi:glycosyltransferase involved in cell wall biosynthesis